MARLPFCSIVSTDNSLTLVMRLLPNPIKLVATSVRPPLFKSSLANFVVDHLMVKNRHFFQ